MATILTTSSQYLSTAKSAIDAALQPVSDFNSLTGLSTNAKYIGMEITVLNNGVPMKFFNPKGTKNSSWKVKEIFPIQDYATLEKIPILAPTVPLERYTIGLKVTVVADETNDNKPTEYKVTAIDSTNNVITWERCETVISISGDDIEAETTEAQE